MEIRNLNTFLKVASLRNFTRAASELGYSQSNVSAQIAQLERELGAPLFNRIGKQVSLTQLGEEMLPYAQELCSMAANIEDLAKPDSELGGTLRIGMTDSISDLLLDDAFITYHRRMPNVQVEVALDTSAMLLERLRGGVLDAACVIDEPLPPDRWLVLRERSVPVVIAANPKLDIAKKETVSLEELTHEELILMEAEAPYGIAFERALARRKLPCRPAFRLQSVETALRVIEREGFVSVLPYYSVKAAAESGKVTVLNVPEWKDTQAVQMVLHRSKALTRQISAFVDELDNVLGKSL